MSDSAPKDWERKYGSALFYSVAVKVTTRDSIVVEFKAVALEKGP